MQGLSRRGFLRSIGVTTLISAPVFRPEQFLPSTEIIVLPEIPYGPYTGTFRGSEPRSLGPWTIVYQIKEIDFIAMNGTIIQRILN
jgi:hypothetical protein